MQDEENNTLQKFGYYLKESLMVPEDVRKQIRHTMSTINDLPNRIERQHEKFIEDAINLLREKEK